jgi:hypothetical protein
MRFITGLIFIVNILSWIVFDIFCWYATGITLGLIILIGIIAFLIAWGLSGEVVIAPLDYLSQTSWEIFIKKIKWSNLTCVIVMSIFTFVCIIMDWFQLREFLNINIQ